MAGDNHPQGRVDRLILELLRNIRAELAEVKDNQCDLKTEFRSVVMHPETGLVPRVVNLEKEKEDREKAVKSIRKGVWTACAAAIAAVSTAAGTWLWDKLFGGGA